MSPVLAAIAVVIKDNQALLVQRSKSPGRGLWGFPGGHVELGETAKTAAIRELREETGVVAHPVAYLTNVDVIRHDEQGGVVDHYLLAAVLCRYVSGSPVADDDALDACWVDCESIRSGTLPMSASVCEVMELALARS